MRFDGRGTQPEKFNWRPVAPSLFLCRLRSDDTDACTARSRKEPTGSTPQTGECQSAKDDSGKPVREGLFLARSGRRTGFRNASLLGETKPRRRRSCTPIIGRDQGWRRCWWRSTDDRNWRLVAHRYHQDVSAKSALFAKILLGPNIANLAVFADGFLNVNERRETLEGHLKKCPQKPRNSQKSARDRISRILRILRTGFDERIEPRLHRFSPLGRPDTGIVGWPIAPFRFSCEPHRQTSPGRQLVSVGVTRTLPARRPGTASSSRATRPAFG